MPRLRTAIASPIFTGCAGFTRSSLSRTWPASIASAARLRVLKKRAAHSHLSMRTRASATACGASARLSLIGISSHPRGRGRRRCIAGGELGGDAALILAAAVLRQLELRFETLD